MILEEGSYLTIVNNNLGFNELGLDLRSLQYSTISGNKVYNSNEQGIALKDFSIYNIISENVLFDDQGTPTQNRGFEELDSSDYNKIYSNIAFGNTDGQITPKGSHTVCKFNVGYNSEGSGSSVGTDSQQTIAHGLSFTPTPEQIVLTAGSSTAQPFLSADPDSTNIYVTAGSGQTWYWTVVSE
jgi:parallel beta-helix repeat protein